ncbi:MAG: Crp/Fnr family transcriptional regulator, partial [Aggregatilineales bacterium]
RYPALAMNYIRYQTDRQREMMARMHALMRMDAPCRLLGTLLSLSRRHGTPRQNCYRLNPSLTQEDLAKMAGLNRSTVSSLINRFRREGLLGGTGRALTVNHSAVEKRLSDVGVEILE